MKGPSDSNRDYAGFYPAEEKLLRRYLTESNQTALPSTLSQYLQQVVTPTLERQKRTGAVALKFEAAYLRLLDFDLPNEQEVAWLSNRTARQALALALTGMMNDGEVTRERAIELARMVLRENALKLYGLNPR